MFTADVPPPTDAPVLTAVPTTVDVPIHGLEALAVIASPVLLALLVVAALAEPSVTWASPAGRSLPETAPPQAVSMARSAPRAMVRKAKSLELMKIR
jgi:hypothetical protein